MSHSISFLLGAGFSVPMGYPTGKQLNDDLISIEKTDFQFHTDGTLLLKSQNSYKTSYDYTFHFCCDLMQYFNVSKGYFDYEEFYDFFKYDAVRNKDVEQLFNNNYKRESTDFNQMISDISIIYTQLVSHYLKDKDNNSYYQDVHLCKPTYPGYTGILNCIEDLGNNYEINFHTLNHDLLFESFNSSDWLQNNLCDGFEELKSPYYGDLFNNNYNYKVRLQYYTGNYNKKYKLFKLHGSKDYALYYTANGTVRVPAKYIKSKYGIGFSRFYKEIENKNNVYGYEDCNVNYHSDFLTGTTSKIERYKEPLLFKKLFRYFKNNLKNADKLIIIGYGCKDSAINKMMLENYNFKDKPTYIINPSPDDEVKKLSKKFNATLIREKNLENLVTTDFN